MIFIKKQKHIPLQTMEDFSSSIRSLPPEILQIIVDQLELVDKINLMVSNKIFLDLCRRSIYACPSDVWVKIFDHSSHGRARRRSDPWSDYNNNNTPSTPHTTPVGSLARSASNGGDSAVIEERNFFSMVFKCLKLRKVFSMSGRHVANTRESLWASFLRSLKSYQLSGSVPLGSFVRSLDIHAILDDCDVMDDEMFKYVIAECSNLLRLNLSGCWKLTDSSFLLLSYLPTTNTLLCLNLTGCASISDESFCLLVSKCANLESINLKDCEVGDLSLFAMSKNCKKLQRIRLQNCWRITDLGLSVLVREVGSQMFWLDLSHCSGIGDEGLISVALNCPKLQWLDLTRAQPQQKDLFSTRSSSSDSLKSASLRGQYSVISDKSIQLLGQRCKELELLDLSYCVHVTDDGLVSLSHSAEKLKSLSLKGMDLITRKSILALGELRKRCKKLIWLQIFQCRQINSAVIDEMIEKLADGWRKGPYNGDVHKEVMNGKSWEDVG